MISISLLLALLSTGTYDLAFTYTSSNSLSYKYKQCVFVNSSIILIAGLNGQRSVQNVTIDPVNPQSQLIIRSGDYHNLTCKIAVVESTAESTPTTINFFQMGYSYAIMQPMNVTNSYTCAVTGSTQVCERVAVIDESLRNQVVQCAFIVDGIFFYSRSVFVKGNAYPLILKLGLGLL